jgi:O-antigen/teichoic acid export membrane protein
MPRLSIAGRRAACCRFAVRLSPSPLIPVPALLPSAIRREILDLAKPERFRRHGFLRNIFLVMSGTGSAQLIGILFSPILSRIYTPADFGIYGSFASVVGILSSVLTLQYSEALMLPERDEVAARLFVAACVSAATIATVVAVVSSLMPRLLALVLNAQELGKWFWVAPFAAMLLCLNQSLTSWCSRKKAFKRTAAAQVVRSLSASSVQTAAGFAGAHAGGLVGGTVIGEIFAGVSLWSWVLREDGSLFRRSLDRSLVKSAVKDYRDFPMFSTPQSLLNAISLGAPVILLIHYYGGAVGGFYAFAVRILQAPMNFILTSLRQVLNQKLNEVHNSGGSLGPLFAKCTGTLFLVALFPTVLGMVLAPTVFSFAFGKQWVTAGECARWLLVWFLPMFCNVPSVLLARILRQQRNLLIFDVTLTSTRLVVLALGGSYLSAVHTVAVFSVVGSIFNLLLIAYVWRLVRNK